MMKLLWLNERNDSAVSKDLGLLLLRLVVGAFMMTHGWAKLSNFSMMSEQFPAMLGMSSKMALSMIVFAEFFASIALILGLLTRLSVIPLIIGMGVAGFVAHGGDPFSVRELPLLYFSVYVVILIAGAGRFSADGLIKKAVHSR